MRSPIFCFAVGEGTQLALEAMNDAAAGAYTVVKLITTSLPEAVTDLTGHVGRQVHVDFRTVLMWSATTWAVKGVPSENLTPGGS